MQLISAGDTTPIYVREQNVRTRERKVRPVSADTSMPRTVVAAPECQHWGICTGASQGRSCDAVLSHCPSMWVQVTARGE